MPGFADQHLECHERRRDYRQAWSTQPAPARLGKLRPIESKHYHLPLISTSNRLVLPLVMVSTKVLNG